MRILVIGASGGSGRAVCDELLDRGHSVTAFARRAGELPDRPGLTRVPGDATNPDDLDGVLPGHDAMVVILGISEPMMRVRLRGASGTYDDVRSRGTHAIVAAARRAGIERIVVQSSYGVGETRHLLPGDTFALPNGTPRCRSTSCGRAGSTGLSCNPSTSPTGNARSPTSRSTARRGSRRCPGRRSPA